MRPDGAGAITRVPGGRTAAAGAHRTVALCLRPAAGRRLCARRAGAAADRRRHGGARPGARAAGAAGAYGGGKPRGGTHFRPRGTAPARPAPHRGAGRREGAGGGRCSARTHDAGGVGGGVRVAGAARCPLAGAAPACGGASCLPAAQNDGRAADVPRAGNRLAARHGRARRPRCGLSRAVRRGDAAAARLPGGGERLRGRAARRARHARGGKRPRSPIPAVRRAADRTKNECSGGTRR